MFLMTVGEIFLESLSTGVITEREVNWLASHQTSFDRPEEAAAIRLGRLMDQGEINLGCRLPEPMLHHQEVLVDWIEPLGRRRHGAAACTSRPSFGVGLGISCSDRF